ncbi:MAG: TolR [Alphaproteobacteria bacterium]|jgi:biopolymer transport protein TolR|nr:TolR [Alphaproteobacteria bacterium]
MGAKLAGRTRGHKRAAVMSEINVTPMVDVMLVLLIIFMVTAPLLSAGVQVTLPKANAKSLSQNDSKPLEVSIDGSGQIYLGETKVTLDRLTGMLQAIATESKDRRVYLRADTKLPYGKVAAVMGTITTSGLSNVSMLFDSQGK